MTDQSPFLTAIPTLADLAEIRGASAMASDLRRAATAIAALDAEAAERLLSRARRGRLDNEPGISPTLHDVLREVALGDGGEAIKTARSRVPLLIRRLLEVSAVHPSQALALVRLGIVTRADLEQALDGGRLTGAFGGELGQRLARTAATLATEQRPISLGRAWDFVDGLLSAIAASGAVLDAIAPSGDIRRAEPLVGAFVVVASAPNPVAAVEALCAMRGADDVLHRTSRRVVVSRDGVEVDVRVAAPDEHGTVLLTTTGSRAHLAALAGRVRPVLSRTEDEAYAAAGLPFIPPELRQGTGEVDAAACRALPRLVSRGDILGDLHMHSTYSDGTDSVDAMVRQGSALGYEYLAITDHSEGAAASRTLARDQIARQRGEIDRLRAQHPHMAILHGVEVDILPDGRLDFPDDVLARFDIVLASMHESARQDGRTLTRRCITAMRHPLVTIISHPANRLVGRRPGYPLDFDAIYAAAVETGTALEIDGAPSHLDLDGEHARAAVAAGVTVSIDSDCHRARSLDRQMGFGIGTARRGWVEPRHVLNTRPLAELLAFIRAKRTPR